MTALGQGSDLSPHPPPLLPCACILAACVLAATCPCPCPWLRLPCSGAQKDSPVLLPERLPALLQWLGVEPLLPPPPWPSVALLRRLRCGGTRTERIENYGFATDLRA